VLIVAALLAVYLIWGSTYLGLRFGLRGFPPFLLNGLRFVLAGGIMYVVLRARGATPPTPVQWKNVTGMGVFLLVGGAGLVVLAEDFGVGSGIVATAIAVMPLWAALFGWLYGLRPRRLEWLGLVVGFLGAALLAREGDFQAAPAGLVLMIIAPMSWAFGSVWGSRRDLPDGPIGSAGQLLAGGAVLVALGLVRGERITTMPGAVPWVAFAYLVVFGSIVAYSAYVFLLGEVRPALATSYAYVNPVVAVLLGVTIGGEILTGPAFVALPLVIAGVALVGAGQRRAQPPAPLPVAEGAA